MIFKRFYDESLAQASYLIGCEKTRDADFAGDIGLQLRKIGLVRIGGFADTDAVDVWTSRAGKTERLSQVDVRTQGGLRSAIAASFLKPHGLTGVSNLEGGYDAWVASELPVER